MTRRRSSAARAAVRARSNSASQSPTRPSAASARARTWRAFLALRSDRPTEAAADLDQIEDAVGRAPTAGFYRTLLLMQRGAPAAQVLTALQQAKQQGSEAWSDVRGLPVSRYPEATSYLDHPELGRHFRR